MHKRDGTVISSPFKLGQQVWSMWPEDGDSDGKPWVPDGPHTLRGFRITVDTPLYCIFTSDSDYAAHEIVFATEAEAQAACDQLNKECADA